MKKKKKKCICYAGKTWQYECKFPTPPREGSNSLPLSMEDSHMPVGYQEEGGKGVLQFWIDQRIILMKNLGKVWQL